MINRGAVMLRYKAPAVKWVNEAAPMDRDASLSLEDINRERTVYLVEDTAADDSETLRHWIELNFQDLFENELESWYLDESLWPKPLTIELFDQWFDVECHSVVIDTLNEPIIPEEQEATPGPPDRLLN